VLISLNSPEFGLFLLVVIAFIMAMLLHVTTEHYWRASLIAATISGLIWTGLAAVINRWDAYIGIAWLFATFWAFVISCLVGVPFRVRRSARRGSAEGSGTSRSGPTGGEGDA